LKKVTPFLLFGGQAEEAARFYVSLLPDSQIDRVTRWPADTPSGPAGAVLTVEFTLGGTRFVALNGPEFPFIEAVSFQIACADQAEVDRLISRELVGRQAQYIFICLRQAILNFPMLYARRAVGLADDHQAKAVLTKAAHEFLAELASFPEKAINPDWLRSLEADGQDDGKPHIRPSRGQRSRAEQKKAKIRRRKKTETMRKLRAKG
jgi:hypothetical protein